jgi:hypothetical protein
MKQQLFSRRQKSGQLITTIAALAIALIGGIGISASAQTLPDESNLGTEPNPEVIASAAQSDFLANETLTITSNNAAEVLQKTSGDLKGIFQRYKPAIDSSTKIIKPVQVTGPQNRPVVKMTLEVLFGIAFNGYCELRLIEKCF